MADIALDPVEIAGLWSLQGNRDTGLSELISSVFASPGRFGQALLYKDLCLLSLWPGQAYLLSEQLTPPPESIQFQSLLTDISHGFCRFDLHGEPAFDFIAGYLSLDITSLKDSAACRRCRLGQYTVILWWQDARRIQLLVERSYARSFGLYIDELIARWRPKTL